MVFKNSDIVTLLDFSCQEFDDPPAGYIAACMKHPSFVVATFQPKGQRVAGHVKVHPVCDEFGDPLGSFIYKYIHSIRVAEVTPCIYCIFEMESGVVIVGRNCCYPSLCMVGVTFVELTFCNHCYRSITRGPEGCIEPGQSASRNKVVVVLHSVFFWEHECKLFIPKTCFFCSFAPE
ncbi:hypothetical protein SDC9_138326 [bioreactor metagenome]|uniref:Uncharacterized protein n=1 Tax=bioreactor metagenome TaxID=1076179 RepID=A0A645DPQ1_9ZZZZ